jgi:uncharacterized GH25 family protein
MRASKIPRFLHFQRRRAPCFAALCGLCLCSLAGAHDFWIQPNNYWVQPQSVTPLTLQVGHGPFRQRSPIPRSRITRFNAISPGGRLVDLRERLHLAGAVEDADLQFQEPGSYVLVLETDDRAQSHLPALRFNDYLKAEGLAPALEQRQRNHRMDAEGSENYSRHTKAIVQVGTLGSGSQVEVTKPVGLPLEIVPEKSPYAMPRPPALPIRVLYQGEPLAGALVKLTNLDHDEAPLEMQVTNSEGRARFTMPIEGAWLVNVIWTKPLPRYRETDFETFFSSLSFGFTSKP